MVFRMGLTPIGFPDVLEGEFVNREIRNGMVVGINEVQDLVRGNLVQATPVALGLTRNSWVKSAPEFTGNEIEGKVSSSAIAASVLETGARPHSPPLAALEVWARRKPGVVAKFKTARRAAVLTQAAIAKRGLPRPGAPRRIFTKVVDRLQGAINGIMDRTVVRIVAALMRR